MVAAGTFSTDTGKGTASISRNAPSYGHVTVSYSPTDDFFGERAQVLVVPEPIFDRLVRTYLGLPAGDLAPT